MPDDTKKRRRGHHEGTGYQRVDGRWEWKVTLPDGTRRSFYAKTQRAARDRANAALRDLEEGLSSGDAETVKVGAFLDGWLEQTAKERLRPSTLASYRGLVANHIKPTLGSKRLRALAVQDVNDMLAGIVSSGRTPATANLVRATLRTARASALKWGYVSRNVASLSDARKVQREQVRPLTIDQAREFLQKTREHRHGMLYHVAIHTGMRQGELLALTWDDVDLDARSIRVGYTLTMVDKELSRTAPKSERSRRVISLSDSAVGALRTQQELIRVNRMLAAGRWQEHNLVFPSSIGTPLHGSNVTHEFQRQLEELGFPQQRFHDLRHCTASILLAEGMDLFTVKEVLGHSQISLTANTYGHLTEKGSAEAAKRIGKAFDDN